MIQKISSLQNHGIKNLIQLATKSKARRMEKLFLIEGGREISRALANGYTIDSCYFCPQILTTESEKVLKMLDQEVKLYEVSEGVYSKIAYRENVDGILVTAHFRSLSLSELKLNNDALVLVLETIEKPGNLGAILRTADGAGVDAVIICDSQTDIFNPNVVRSSLGCLFSMQLALCESMEAIRFLKQRNIRIYAAALQNSVSYSLQNYKESTAFVMGSEAEGLSEIWRKEADKIISIPMAGIADSLNVSVSAAVLVYEAIRQRSN
ncbi:MAG: RNA methyltransferase [Bacteroidales bacterium]|nr:RNA methyltransferase [Bacteroidales bacterium]